MDLRVRWGRQFCGPARLRPTRSLRFCAPMIAGLLIGLVVGALGAWLLLRSKNAELSARFGVLAAEALHRNNESFLYLASGKLEVLKNEATHELEQRKKDVEHLVQPIRDSLQKVDGKLQDLEGARTRAYSELRVEVRQLAESQNQLRSETGNLVSALRDRPNVRGRWGEIQLRRVVEMAGMLEHCHFETQAHVATEDRRLRPDLLVKLPGSKTVGGDSKFAG